MRQLILFLSSNKNFTILRGVYFLLSFKIFIFKETLYICGVMLGIVLFTFLKLIRLLKFLFDQL